MIAPFLIVAKIGLQKIWEEEDFKDDEHDKKLDQNNQPNLFAPAGKVYKPFLIKPESTFYDIHILGYKWID